MYRRAFTLVEMLVTVVIIGMLATLSLAAFRVVQQSVKIDRTRSTIAKIDAYVMEEYEALRTRRIPVNVMSASFSAVPVGAPATAEYAGRSLDTTRDFFRLELPDRWSDITSQPLVFDWTTNPTTGATQQWTDHKPAATLGMQGIYLRARNALLTKGKTLDEANAILSHYESAKLLYMIVMRDQDARDHFREDEVTRPDEDGLPVFVDAWGNPILFIRWAPGFDQSEIQSEVTPIDNAAARLAASVDVSNRDDLNTEGVYRTGGMLAPVTTESGLPTATVIPISIGWKLLPLIYSAGPDGVYDIWAGTSADQFAGNPYAVFTGFTPARSFGSAVDFDADGMGHYDNITNHQGTAR